VASGMTGRMSPTHRGSVEFRADGRTGNVELVSGLGSGLDEEAMRAARSIRFTLAQENGQPVTTTMDIKYRFVNQ
jgi:TonB family protein